MASTKSEYKLGGLILYVIFSFLSNTTDSEEELVPETNFVVLIDDDDDDRQWQRIGGNAVFFLDDWMKW